MTAEVRRTNWRRGRLAEAWAAVVLRLKGYKVLARNARGPFGEIDVIALRGRTLVAVEIKSRVRMAEALEAISPRQRRRIERALSHFQASHRGLGHCTLRFDAICVGPYGGIHHIADAWRPL